MFCDRILAEICLWCGILVGFCGCSCVLFLLVGNFVFSFKLLKCEDVGGVSQSNI